jgi:hypothetical protein
MDLRPAPTPLVYHDHAGAASEETGQSGHLARRVSLLAVCVGVYRTHCDGGSGQCAACGSPSPCRSRRYAVAVIEAHADDPARYDAAASPPLIAR